MQIKSIGVVLLLLAILLVTGWLNPSFLSDENVKSIIRWTSLFGFISLGMSLVIMTGGIDLSIGSVIALAGVCMLMLLNQQHVDSQQKTKVLKVEKVPMKNNQLPKVTLGTSDWTIRTDDQLRFVNSFGQPVQGSVVSVEKGAEGLSVILREPNANFPVDAEGGSAMVPVSASTDMVCHSGCATWFCTVGIVSRLFGHQSWVATICRYYVWFACLSWNRSGACGRTVQGTWQYFGNDQRVDQRCLV